MTKTIDAGVFIPVGNHGWIHSVNSPAVEDGSFRRVLEVTRNAEALGFDFVLSPGIWRGFKGPSEHWMRTLESMTTSAALLQATTRIGVFGTIHMTVYQPAIIAKMMTTLDQIGPGRVGLNLVTGSSYLDLSHVGLWRDGLSHDERYDLADEWIAVVRRLWTEPIVSHKGRFFELTEATMGPKPSRMPPLANAGASGRGFKFAVENCDIAFIGASDDAKSIASGKQAKAMARQMNKPDLKVYGLFVVIPGDTDAEAQARFGHFNDGGRYGMPRGHRTRIHHESQRQGRQCGIAPARRCQGNPQLRVAGRDRGILRVDCAAFVERRHRKRTGWDNPDRTGLYQGYRCTGQAISDRMAAHGVMSQILYA